MNESSIAIIIPVYNVEKYIEETVLSIINQTSLPDEIIFINDGSTDNSDLILSKFTKFPGIVKYNTTNRGSGPARNLGRSYAKSDYVYFLDADDTINKNFIYEIRSAIKEYKNPDVILFSGKTFSEIPSPKNQLNLKFTLSGKFTQKSGLINKLINRKEALPQPGRYISKNSLWTTNKIIYPSVICEDEAVFLPLLAYSKNTIILPKVFLNYRIGRDGSVITSKSYLKYLESNLYMINFISLFMKNNPLLIKNDISGWRYRLGRNGLKYISMCTITNTPIKWKTIFKLIILMRSLSYFLKITWRIIKTKFKFKI